jgi:hypothetical protein
MSVMKNNNIHGRVHAMDPIDYRIFRCPGAVAGRAGRVRPKAVMRETPCDRLSWTPLLVAWEKQALYGHPSKPNRIGHAIRHQVQKLLADNNSQLAIAGIIAEGSTTYFSG